MIRIVLLSLALASCGWMQQSTDIGDGSTAVVNQQQDAAQGAKVASGVVDDIVTNNTDGIPVYWFLIGGLVMGIVIPQPYWMKMIW
jgi:hypothetical protein